MGWKDFFYFSKGERRALTLLLLVISTAFILLILKDFYILPKQESAITKAETETNVVFPDTVSTTTAPSAPQSEQSINPTTSPKRKYTAKPRFTKSASTFAQKYPKGTIVELNSADTTVLKKVPGIGTAFANRIVKYRELLGGYYAVSQLREVYGIDEEKYTELAVWFEADASLIRQLAVNEFQFESLPRHPYLNYKQARVIIRMQERKGKLSGWEMLDLLEEFTEADKARLKPYLSFD
jgi:DNA uptake protein and related DNA-binding proteins